MENVQTIGIIGAGISGIVTAKTCLEYGFRVKVFEKENELGGVWTSSRRYPGITTQNTKDTYCFSDFPMPKKMGEWPTGQEAQSYLVDYAKKFHVSDVIRFGHNIQRVDRQNNAWTIRGEKAGVYFSEYADWLIICNGTFSDPFIPSIPGIDSFVDAGGEVLHSTQFHEAETARGKRSIVVGYSKSAHDVVTAVADTAASTHLLFREAKWKVPRFIKGMNMKHLLLNRLGEAIIKPDGYNRAERWVYRLGLPKKMIGFMERYITKAQMLQELGLVPSCSIRDHAFGEISLETPGFFEKVKQGSIIAKKSEIVSFNGNEITLSTGQRLSADLVVFATGFRQTIPFLPAALQQQLTDSAGNYLLYHHILPAGIPALAFVGYNSSIQCPLSSEFAALWVCEYLKGRIPKLTDEQILAEGKAFIKWRSQFRPNSASRGLSTMPGTIQHVDLLLKDMNAPMPFLSLIPDWLLTSNPARYAPLRRKIVARNKR